MAASKQPTGMPTIGDAALEQALAEMESALESANPARAESVLRKYPDLTVELEEYCANRAALDELAQPIRHAVSGISEPPVIPGYRVERLHDEGGMGFIYRAHYERLNQVVALKVMRDDRPLRDEDVRRFRNEARCASDLDHPSIISVYDIGLADERPYYAMTLVMGKSLKECLAESGAYESRDAANLMLEIAEAMASAHHDGVVHRDLKPGNILIDRHGHPRIIDFGLAKRENEPDAIEPGTFVGTPFYCSPEQADYRAHEAGAAADVYSLGAILYEMLIGQPPLQGANYEQTLEKVREHEPLPVRAHNQSVDRDLETICMRCLRKDPNMRYPDAHELAEDLRRYLKGHTVASNEVHSSFWDWILWRGYEEKISKVGPRLLCFQAIYTACILALQVLLVLNWGEPLAWLLAFGSLVLLFSILKTDESTGSLPSNPSERLLWSIWMATILAHLMLAIAMRLSLGYVAGFNQTYALMPFITGVALFIQGCSFWKQNLMWGSLWWVLGVVSVTLVALPWAPLVYITFSCLCTSHLVIAQLQLARQRSAPPEPPGGTRVVYSD